MTARGSGRSAGSGRRRPPGWIAGTLLGVLAIGAIAYAERATFLQLVAPPPAPAASLFSIDRVRPGMTVDEVEQVVPLADRVEYYRLQDGALLERFVYIAPLVGERHVNVIYDGARVIGASETDEWLQGGRPLPPEAAYRALRALRAVR